MTPENKKRLIYGTVIVTVGVVGIYLWKKYETAAGAQSGTATNDEQAQADALAQEEQLAAIASLGSSGSQLSSPNLGETPVENFGQEVSSVLQAAGLAPPQTAPTTGTGGTTASPVTTGTPTPISTPVTTSSPVSPTNPIIERGPIAEEVAGKKLYEY